MSHNWTQAEVDAHNARVRKENRIQSPPGPEAIMESEIHDEILAECRRRGWIALHGSMAHKARRTPGEFDFIILADGGRVLLVECKTFTGKLSVEQQALHHHAKRLGHEPHVVRSFQQFLDLL